MKNKNHFFLILFIFLTNLVIAQTNIIPKPNSVQLKEGTFSFKNGVDIKVIRGDNPTKLLQQQLTDFIKSKKISIVQFSKIIVSINLQLPKPGESASEAYALTVAPNAISITSTSNAGLFYGMQSLFQLMKADTVVTIPCVEIADEPVFSYRGMHLDVSRHFFGIDVIKQYLDVMAKLKLNQFHWHLTDDQGWRIEIKKYPKLTSIGGCRTEKDNSTYCGFYTQEEIKEIVQYANERFITIIPEIDVPGHSSAIIASYPELGCYRQEINVPNTFGIKEDILCPSDSTFQFLKDVFDEVCILFPSKNIHIGGDEVPTKHWTESEAAKTFCKQQSIDISKLSSHFLNEIENYLATKGRKCIGWGEVMEDDISKDITVMSWRNNKAGIAASKRGNDVIMTPRTFCYFDYFQDWDETKDAIYMTYLPMSKVYSFNPLTKIKGDAQKHILGGQACVWTEFISTKEKLQNQVYPRISAMAECLWTNKSSKKYSDFQKRLSALRNYFVNEKELPKIDLVRIKPKKENQPD